MLYFVSPQHFGGSRHGQPSVCSTVDLLDINYPKFQSEIEGFQYLLISYRHFVSQVHVSVLVKCFRLWSDNSRQMSDGILKCMENI